MSNLAMLTARFQALTQVVQALGEQADITAEKTRKAVSAQRDAADMLAKLMNAADPFGGEFASEGFAFGSDENDAKVQIGKGDEFNLNKMNAAAESGLRVRQERRIPHRRLRAATRSGLRPDAK